MRGSGGGLEATLNISRKEHPCGIKGQNHTAGSTALMQAGTKGKRGPAGIPGAAVKGGRRAPSKVRLPLGQEGASKKKNTTYRGRPEAVGRKRTLSRACKQTTFRLQAEKKKIRGRTPWAIKGSPYLPYRSRETKRNLRGGAGSTVYSGGIFPHCF